MPSLLGVHETVLYGPDVRALAAFYRDVLGLTPVGNADDQSAALRLPRGDAVLLLFNPEYAAQEGRGVPAHGARGPGHVAFRVPSAELDAWRAALTARGIPIELERGWSRGGRSIYIRDPAGNSVEIVEGEIWPPARAE